MSTKSIVEYWLEKADEDLASAGENFQAGRLSNAVRDAYYACFHAFSAVLLRRGIPFKKHREVRSILHRDFIREKKIEAIWGKHYDWLIDNRQKADYRPLVQFDPEQTREIVNESRGFVKAMRKMVESRTSDS
jgi:uncharacterized protein (UPF0332 family)